MQIQSAATEPRTQAYSLKNMQVFFDYQTFTTTQYNGISRYFVELAARLSVYPDVKVKVVSPIIRSLFLGEQRSRVPTVGIDLSHVKRLPAKVVRPIDAVLFNSYVKFDVPDIVHETAYGRKKTVPKSARMVTTIHDTIPDRFPNIFVNNKKHRAAIQNALNRADRVICVSQSTRRDVQELYEVDPSRLSVVMLGSSLAPSPDGPLDIGMPYFLHVGARYEYKNFTGLIKAFGDARLFRTHKLVSFTRLPFEAMDFNAMDSAGVPRESVVRVGGDDRMLARYYAGAEALVFPSLYEGFGIPLVEAMHCGCPIISSNTSSLPEVAGDAALYCDPRDIRSISEAMVQVASSPAMKSLLIAKGQARAPSLSWARCAAETYAIYKDLL